MAVIRGGRVKLASVMTIAAVAALVAGVGARAAELPSREAKPPASADQAKTCEVNGVPGMAMPGSDVCVKIGGYVSSQVSVGSVGAQRRIVGAP
jgi:hypothetical protein